MFTTVSILHRTCERDARVRVWAHLGNPIHAAYTFYQQNSSLMIRASYWFSLGLEIMPRPWIFYLIVAVQSKKDQGWVQGFAITMCNWGYEGV